MGKHKLRSFAHPIWYSANICLARFDWSPGAILLLLPRLSQTAAERDWFFEANTYLWVADVAIETTPPLSTAPAIDRYETKISTGEMLAAQVHSDAVGLFVDFAWLRLSTDFSHSTCSGGVPITMEREISCRSARRCLAVERQRVSGVRGWRAAGLQRQRGKQVAESGRRRKLFLRSQQELVDGCERYFGQVWVAADFAAEFYAAVSCRTTNRCSLTAGNRYLQEESSRDVFAFNVDTPDFLLGVGFHFKTRRHDP